MNPLSTVPLALRSLRANRLRSALTMLGIIIGVAAVITMIAVGAGAQARVQEQIAALGSNMMIIVNSSVSTGGVRLGSGSAFRISEDDAEALERELIDIRTAPAVRGQGQVVAHNQNWNTIIYGITPAYHEVRRWPVVLGRAIEGRDLVGAQKVVVIGQTIARNLFGDADPVGQLLRVRHVPFTIVGVLERKGQNLMGQDQDDVVLIPISTARTRVLGRTAPTRQRYVSQIWVTAAEDVDMKIAEDQVREVMRQRHRVQSGQEDSFFLRNLSEVLAAREASSRVLTLLLAAVASVSLVVGGIGIMNIMLVSVTERTREIGLRMAVGARGRDILAQFLIEAVTLSVIGGLVGIVLGIGASVAIGHFADWRTELTVPPILLAVGFAAAVGIFFGFYPARKASRMEPIEALRYE